MKYGAYLASNIDSDFDASNYIDYNRLKILIRKLSDAQKASVNYNQKSVSMSAPAPTSNTGQPTNVLSSDLTDEDFFSAIDKEMEKVETFTKNIVRGVRNGLRDAEKDLKSTKNPSSSGSTSVQATVDEIGTTFLKLEKYVPQLAPHLHPALPRTNTPPIPLPRYVNLNFMGFHKILKKHDKFLPNKCKQFYVGRMHNQSWVKGDYSDIVVQLSAIYSEIRGDARVEEKVSEP